MTEPPNEIYVGLGSNLESPRQQVDRAAERLAQHPHFELVARSKWYRSKAVGPGRQPDYVNGAVLIRTPLDALQVLDVLQAIEAEHHRSRRVRWGPRTLDLDLLLFGNLVLTLPTLQIPHPRMHERAFVLVPLAEVASHWVDPISGKAIAELVQNVSIEGVHRLSEHSLAITPPNE